MSLIILDVLKENYFINASAAPPRDRQSQAEKATTGTKQAWLDAWELAKEKGQTPQQAARMACIAYKLAMPKMDTLPAIRANIACIAQGINLEVFNGRDGSQLIPSVKFCRSA